MKRVMLAVGVLCAAVYMKLLLPGFATDFIPLLKEWLALEQIVIPLPEEAMSWLILP